MDSLGHDEAENLTIVASAWNGEIVTKVLSRNTTDGIWRLVLDVRPTGGDTVELAAHIAGYGRKLTETWLYQWIHA